MNPEVLTSWLGAGGQPVEKSEAQRRSEICLKCPLNVEPKWWERMTKNPIAEAIRVTLELKHGMNLSVEGEDKCGVCKICGCALPLKIWVGMEHIRNQVGNLQDAPAFCWMKE